MEPEKKNDVLISLHDVSLVRDRKYVLRDVDLTINRNDFIAITGPNGGGKTTLLRLILRLLTPTTGTVVYESDGGQSKLRIGYLPQKNMIDSRFPISVSEVIASGLISVPGFDKDNIAEQTRRMLELVEMENYANQCIGELSGGQLQRTLFARALASEPDVLVLDEPLSYLDKHFERHIYDIIARLASNTTILLVSHEVSAVAAMANRHIVVDRTLHFCQSSSHFVHYDCDGEHVC